MQPDPQSLALANEMDPSGELAARVTEQFIEYNTYVAASDVTTPGGVLAYRKGDPMPVSNVVKHSYWAAGVAALVDGAEHHETVLDQVQDDEGDTPPADAPAPPPAPQGSGTKPMAATVATGASSEGTE